ncbi:uridine kinase family protein [Nonomuraea typhae]|uniref:uridine kinase family protein n=1 Tax=Nonomuraea typhae TaxID=2603600 RepID=UPI0012F8841E|nr:(d)CMP kinase [Nonomuraea typhae]
MQSLARRIRALPPSCGPVRLIAVDGPAGAGKTTFADRLGAALDAQVIHSDDFPVPWSEGPGAWFHALRSQVLDPLAGGRPGRFRRYDWVTARYGAPVDVPAAPVVVIEGVGTARRDADHLLAFRVWLEAAWETRWERVLTRDGAALEPEWRTWFTAEEQWFAEDATRSRADLVITT